MAPAYNVFFDVAIRQLDAELASADALDAKAATIFSVASTVAAVVPAVLPLGRGGIELSSWVFVFLGLGGVAYAGTLVLFILAYRPGKWRSGPNLEDLGRIIVRGEQYARYWAADAYVLALERTSNALRKKQRYLNLLIGAFVLEIVFLTSAGVSSLIR